MPKKIVIKPAKSAPAVGPYNHAVRIGDLLFCAHHARQHMEALKASALDVQDDRHLLVADEAGTR